MTEAEKQAERDKALLALTHALTEEGKLIEAGWVSLQLMAVSPNAPQVQLDEMRMAFFAGAQHVFSAAVGMLDPGDEITDRDLRRMDQIHGELEAFGADFARKHGIKRPGSDG